MQLRAKGFVQLCCGQVALCAACLLCEEDVRRHGLKNALPMHAVVGIAAKAQVVAGDVHALNGLSGSSQQRRKSSLCKMMVARECHFYPPLAHHLEGQAIRQSPFLVHARLI